MPFKMQEYLDALRAGEFDKLINLPDAALHAFYPPDKVSSVGSDQLLPLLIYCFERSGLSDEDLIHLKVLDKVMKEDGYFVQDKVGFNCNTIYSALFSALCMKKAKVSFPDIPLSDFEAQFPKAQKILDPIRDEGGDIIDEGVIQKYFMSINDLLSQEVESEQLFLDEQVQKVVDKTLLYQKKEETCSVLNAYLAQCITQLEKDDSAEALCALLASLYQETKPLMFLTDEMLERVGALTLSLKQDEVSPATDEALKRFPDTVYEPYYAKTIQQKIEWMLEGMARYKDEVAPCARLKASIDAYCAYLNSKKKKEKDKPLMARLSLAKTLSDTLEPYQFLGVEQSELLQTFTLALKTKIEAIPKTKLREKEKALLSILYEPAFLKHISPRELNIISETARAELSQQRFFQAASKKKSKKGVTLELPKTVSFREGQEVLYASLPVQRLHETFWKQRGEAKVRVKKVSKGPPPSQPVFTESDLSILTLPMSLYRF